MGASKYTPGRDEPTERVAKELSGGIMASRYVPGPDKAYQTYNGLPANTPTGSKTGAHIPTAPCAFAKGKGVKKARGNGQS
jgi:hypothetical protein